MAKYHVNSKTGRAGVCKATKKGCPLGAETPHFETKEEANSYIEKTEAINHNTIPITSKKTSNKNMEYKTNGFKSHGVGNFRKLSSNGGKHWEDTLNVEYRKCENFPTQYFDDDKYGDELTSQEEIAVDGEIIGYISLKTPKRGPADYKVYVFETIEQANDPHSRIINTCYGGRKDSIGELIEHHKNYVNKPIDVNNPGKYFTSFNDGVVTSKSIDKDTSIVIEENNYTKNSTYRNIFLIKNGKAVSYIKMSDEKFKNYDGSFNRQTVRCDVETRNSERRKSYAKELSAIIEKEYNTKLQSGGMFTPLGFAAFGNNENRTINQMGMDWNGSNISQMNFIRDWDKLIFNK